jgi:hypothetical protein
MASLIVAGNAIESDVLTGKKFCAGILYGVTGTGTGGASGYELGWNSEEWTNIITETPFYYNSVVDESHTFTAGIITLTHAPGWIFTGQVVTSSDGVTTYTETTNYTVNRSTGVITSVTIPDGTAVLVDYTYISKA